MFYRLFKKRFDNYTAEKKEEEEREKNFREALSALNDIIGRAGYVTSYSHENGRVNLGYEWYDGFRHHSNHRTVYVGSREQQTAFFLHLRNIIKGSFDSQAPAVINSFVRRFVNKEDGYSEGWMLDGKRYDVTITPHVEKKKIPIQDLISDRNTGDAEQPTKKSRPKRRGKTNKGSRKGK